MTSASTAFVLLSLAAAWGALVVALTRDATRMAVGLGVFLAAVAGFFLYLDAPLLAVAQVFVYVGGVLVLVVFAIMLLRRADDGRPEMGSRHDVGAAGVCVSLFVLIVASLWGRLPEQAAVTAPASGTAAALLGPMLPAFEVAGVLLLAALLAALTIVGRAGE